MSFPLRFPHYKHQEREFEEHRDADARALLWQMRTGKTKAVIDLACYRHLVKRDVDAMLVLAPNGVHRNWARRELPAHAWEEARVACHAWNSTRAERRDHLASLQHVLDLRRGLPVLAVNSEALISPTAQRAVKAFLKKRRVLLCVDESHDFRTPGSRRTKLARGLAPRCPVRRILTGTSVSNSPLAAYSQFELVDKAALGHATFTDFKNRYSTWKLERNAAGQSFPVLDQYVHLDELQERLARWSSVVLRSDCEDLPPLMRTQRVVELPDSVREAMKRLRKEMMLELEGGAEVTVTEAGARLIKLQQMLGGFLIDNEGAVHELVPDGENPRLQALLDEVAQTEGKVIVWCQFREDIRRAVRALRGAGHGVVEYHGMVTSQARRDEAIDSFQRDPKVKVFVGQPQAGGSGLDLSAAEAILWYSHTANLIHRDQAMERASKVGKGSVAVVDFVVPGSRDEQLLEMLDAKRSMSDDLAGSGLRDRLLGMLRSMDL